MSEQIFIYKCNLKNPCNKEIRYDIFKNDFISFIDSLVINLMHKFSYTSASINKVRSVISKELDKLVKIKLITKYDIMYENDILTIKLILDKIILL